MTVIGHAQFDKDSFIGSKDIAFRRKRDGRTEERTDGRTDGQPENIMPPAPKGGGGIKSINIENTITIFMSEQILIKI